MSEFVDKLVLCEKYMKKEDLYNALTELGIDDTSDSSYELLMSEHCKFAYARKVFVEGYQVPIVKFSKIWSILKEGSNTGTERIKPIGQMTDEELILVYTPSCSSEIENELNKRCRNKRCIAFNLSGKIDKDVTAKLLKLSKKQDIPDQWIDNKSNVFQIYNVGKWPDAFYEVCPISNEVLVDGYSASTGINWNCIDYKCRQFIRLMIENGIKLDIMNSISIVETLKTSIDGGLEILMSKFPKIAIIFKEYEQLNKLPCLKTKNISSIKNEVLVEQLGHNGPKVYRKHN